VKDASVLLHVRTLLPGDDSEVVSALARALGGDDAWRPQADPAHPVRAGRRL